MIPGVESFLEQYHMIEQSDVVVAGYPVVRIPYACCCICLN